MENRVAKILIVDDIQDNLISLKALINDAFPETIVFTALTGKQGLELAREEDPDVILLDIIMPGMDGFAVCRVLKADKKLCDIPVVFVTALVGDKESRIKALEAGAEAFLSKPIDESELTAQIRAMLKIREANIQNRDEKESLAILVEEKTKELVRSEAKYRQIAENISDVVWTANMDFKTTYISPSVERMLGESPEAHMRKSVEERFTPDSLKEINTVLSEELEKEIDPRSNKNRSRIIEVNQYKSDGSVIWVSMHISFIRNEKGKVTGILGVSRDITKRKKVEKDLIESQKMLSETERIGKVGGWSFNIDTMDQKWTDEVYRIHEVDITPNPGVDTGINFYTKKSRPIIENAVKRAIQYGENYDLELEIITAKGNTRAVHTIGKADLKNRRIYGFFQDITERKLAEVKLRESEEKYRKLFSNMFLGIAIHELILDENGKAVDYRFVDINDEAAVMLGSDKMGIIGKTAKEVFHKESPPYIDKYEAVGLKGKTYSFTAYSATLNRYFLTRAYSIEYKRFITIFEDITEKLEAEKRQKRDEAIIRNQQKLESIGLLASGVAHEINNPINGIMNYGQLILDSADIDDENSEYAKEIIFESQRIAEIVRNLLFFSRNEKQNHSPADIKTIINQTLSLVNTIIRHDQIDLQIDIPDNLPALKCRSQQIQQVIMNLITNSCDALKDKYTGYHEDKIIKITCSQFNDEGRRWIRITVEDHGVGISEDIQDEIFEPFFTSKGRTSGTGLGLYISYGIVMDHHGRLTFDTEEGVFTRFYVDLPVDNGWELE